MDLIQMAYVPRDTPRAQRLPGLLSCGVFAPSSTNDGSYVYGTTVSEFCVLPHLSRTDSLGQAIFSAVQKVGLKLDPAKGPGDFLVIDRVERPSGN